MQFFWVANKVINCHSNFSKATKEPKIYDFCHLQVLFFTSMALPDSTWPIFSARQSTSPAFPAINVVQITTSGVNFQVILRRLLLDGTVYVSQG